MRIIFLSLLLIITRSYLLAQDFSAGERLQGYANIDNDLYFIFDEKHYGIQPKTITITGSFRNWSKELNDKLISLCNKFCDKSNKLKIKIENFSKK